MRDMGFIQEGARVKAIDKAEARIQEEESKIKVKGSFLRIWLDRPQSRSSVKELFDHHAKSKVKYSGAASMGVHGYRFEGFPTDIENLRKSIRHLGRIKIS